MSSAMSGTDGGIRMKSEADLSEHGLQKTEGRDKAPLQCVESHWHHYQQLSSIVGNA